jgi:hypothetical protein
MELWGQINTMYQNRRKHLDAPRDDEFCCHLAGFAYNTYKLNKLQLKALQSSEREPAKEGPERRKLMNILT